MGREPLERRAAEAPRLIGLDKARAPDRPGGRLSVDGATPPARPPEHRAILLRRQRRVGAMVGCDTRSMTGGEVAGDQRWARLVDEHRARQRDERERAGATPSRPSTTARWMLLWSGAALAVPGVGMAVAFLDGARVISRGGIADPIGRFWAVVGFVVLSGTLLLAGGMLVAAGWRRPARAWILVRVAVAGLAGLLLACWVLGADAYYGTDLLRR